MTIYYKVIEVWCPYPWQSEIEERHCLFSFSAKKFKEILGLKIDSKTSIKDKEEYVKKQLDLKTVKIKKL
jgi:hypothetical protein